MTSTRPETVAGWGSESAMRALELKIPPVAIGLFVAALMWALKRFAPDFAFALPAGRLIAIGVAVVGVVIAALGVIAFRRARTTVDPLDPGSASSLVVTGIYRWSRNPMYLGVLLVLLGWGLWLANALALPVAVGFVPLLNRLQIQPEERFLTERFGAAYTDYRSHVRRWF